MPSGPMLGRRQVLGTLRVYGEGSWPRWGGVPGRTEVKMLSRPQLSKEGQRSSVCKGKGKKRGEILLGAWEIPVCMPYGSPHSLAASPTSSLCGQIQQSFSNLVLFDPSAAFGTINHTLLLEKVFLFIAWLPGHRAFLMVFLPAYQLLLWTSLSQCPRLLSLDLFSLSSH